MACVWGPFGPAITFHQGTPGTYAVAKAFVNSPPGTLIGSMSPREHYRVNGGLRRAFPKTGRPVEDRFLGVIPYAFVAAGLGLAPQLKDSVERSHGAWCVAQVKDDVGGNLTQDEVERVTAVALANLHELLSRARYRLKRVRSKGRQAPSAGYDRGKRDRHASLAPTLATPW